MTDPQSEETRMKIEEIAEVAHNVNKAYCESIGDDSQPVWAAAPDWQKEAAVDGVLFHLRNPMASQSASHDNWMRKKEADGWSYGPVKDDILLKHPCMVEYDQLPEAQQVKDALFIAVVHSLLDKLHNWEWKRV